MVEVAEIVYDDFKVYPETRPLWKKRRYLIVLLGFFGFIMVLALRVNLSIAIVAMTENRTVIQEDGTVIYEKEFDWNTQQQGYILSSFFYGYMCTQLPGSYLASRYGGNILLGLGILSTSILTLFSPVVASAGGFGALIVLRVVMGLTEGVVFPCMYEIWSRWAPPLERSRMAGIVYAGTYVGNVLAMSTCGLIAQNLGWPFIFYIFGGIGVCWWICWSLVVRESPEKDPFISEEEKRYIMASLGENKNRVRPNIPWKAILTSSPVWAIAVAHASENWGVYTYLTQLPSYLKYNLDFDLKSSGFIAAIPYLTLAIILFFVGYLADRVQVKGYLTTRETRRYFTCTAYLAQMTFLLLVAYQLNKVLVIVFLSFGAGFGALALVGYGVNHLDIAPPFASVLMGISNTLATIPGILSPTIAGYVVTNQSDREQWKWIFIITACVYVVGCIIYFIFCKAEVQPWAILPSQGEEKDQESGKIIPTRVKLLSSDLNLQQ